MEGRARAPAAGTVLNALATETGAAFAIDEYTRATVELDGGGEVTADVAEDPDADMRLIEECVAAVTDRFGDGEGGHVRTESEVPMAAGLKSSSAAANATVLAALSALEAADELDRADACRLGVDVAREVGVTVTGAFDDASASMLGGVTITDNATDELLAREERDWTSSSGRRPSAPTAPTPTSSAAGRSRRWPTSSPTSRSTARSAAR